METIGRVRGLRVLGLGVLGLRGFGVWDSGHRFKGLPALLQGLMGGGPRSAKPLTRNSKP